MTQTEALKLALEALETHVPHVYKDRGYAPITAIKEVLAQQDENRSALSLYESGFIDGREKGLKEAQRTWVGLTDEDIGQWIEEEHDVLRWAEAKLKEKNT